ncbi:MAG TPA: MBL fold metallo-hydrolase [Thermoanaerobaculia bacterium]|nr:MBL fold metallo-hydrolase [Thermoanaerobaculia bacterium]
MTPRLGSGRRRRGGPLGRGSGLQLTLFGGREPVALLDETRPRPAPRPARATSAGTRLQVLGSGSGGNAVLIESRLGTLLLDAGFSSREIEHRLRSVGVEPRRVDAVLLTHEHHDHCRGAARFARRYRVPVHATGGTFAGRALRPVVDRRVIRAGVRFEIAGLSVLPFPVPHDAREPVGFVIEDEAGFRIGVVADLGALEPAALVHLIDLDVLVLEANHDPEMLRSGPYPFVLKRRVAGDRGHLSNPDAARGLDQVLDDALHTVVLYHLSRVNNRPALALEAVGEAVERSGSSARLVLSDQFQPSGWIDLCLPPEDPDEEAGAAS